MNTEEAKLILGSIHADVDRESDPELDQAFALLDEDPALKSWFEQERAFDDAVAGKLTEIEPPADLRTTLVGLLDNGAPAVSSPAKKMSWFQPQWLAAAAAVVLVPILAIQFFTGSASANSYDEFRDYVVDVAQNPPKLDLKHHDLDALLAHLKKNNATCPDSLPSCVACADSVGCAVLEWGQESVTMICLNNQSGDVVHCFVIPRDQLEALPPEASMRKPLKMNKLTTSGWSDQKFVYVLVGSAPGVNVEAPKLK